MKKHIFKIMIFFLPLLSMLVVSCKDDEEVSYWGLHPKITEISSREGLVGSEVTIVGTNLNNVDRVVFGSVEVTEFNATETTITATVPANVFKGDLNIAVYNPHGSDRMLFTVLVKPTITEVSDAEGLPGDEVVINGADLEGVSKVLFGDVEASFTKSATTITVIVPEVTTSGAHNITVKNSGGEATAPFVIKLNPVVTSITPPVGSAGDVIVVNGIRFNNVQSVTIGDVTTEFTVVSSTELSFIIPDGAGSGFVTVTTTEGSGNSNEALTVERLVAGVDPVDDPALVFFDFNGKNSWWGAVELTTNDAESVDGTAYGKINNTFTGWNEFFFRNGGNDFPGAAIGTNASNYVMKFDINVYEDITGGEFAFRLKGTEGDFWFAWKPWAVSGSYKTDGWVTITIPVTDFKDGAKTIADMNSINSDFGLAFNNGTSKVNIAIDNVRFELEQ